MKRQSRTARAVAAKRLLAFLRDPRSYPGRPRSVQLIQTHASYLVLAGRHAYKVKKPVNFGFLDFSTLAKRRRICEREVALNRRLCPSIYLGVLPISLDGNRLHFGTGGRDRRIRRENAAAAGAVFHAAPVGARRERSARRGRDRRHAQALLRGARTDAGNRRVGPRQPAAHQHAGEFPADGATSSARPSRRAAFEAIRTYTNDFFRRHATLFAARIRERRIRDCHGDLHLEHIHLGPAGVTIYDCIEFNDRFRYIDVASDAAFLAMDLDFRARPDLARHFAARMAQALRDPGMDALLDFYKCYRACVRGKVESIAGGGSRRRAGRAP